MVLRHAGAHPATPCRAARRKPTGHTYGLSAAQRDVDRAAGGEVTARRDEAVRVEKRRCAIDRERLDDAVQIDLGTRPEAEHRPDVPQNAVPGRSGGRLVAVETGGEIPVVARRDDGGPDARVDEPVRLDGCPEGDFERLAEKRRHGAPARRVQSRKLAARAETAEHGVIAVEKRLNFGEACGSSSLDDDLAAHRPEDSAAHDGADPMPGGASAGARIPACSWLRRTTSTNEEGGERFVTPCL